MRDERISQAAALAAGIHAGDVDLQGKPYTDHLAAVAGAVSDDARVVAWLHDAIEDHPSAIGQVRQLASQDEWLAICALTRSGAETYAEYVAQIATKPGRAGELAREVKRADLAHNLGRLTPELERLRPRYVAALERLG